MSPSNVIRAAVSLLKGSAAETRKMVWPQKAEALSTAFFIGALVAGLAIVIWGADKSLEYAIYDLLLHFKK